MNQTYLPLQVAHRVIWLKNFLAKLPDYAAKYGISDAEIKDVKLGVNAYVYWIEYANLYGEYLKKINSFKVEVGNGNVQNLTQPELPEAGAIPDLPTVAIFKRVSSIVTTIKKKTNYSVNDGKDLGIEGTPAQEVDYSTLKPAIKVAVTTGGYPEIKWKKDGHSGVEIHVDKGNNTWQYLAIDLKPNYTDNSPLPAAGVSEVRRYRAIYIEDDKHIGQWSDPVEIALAGV